VTALAARRRRITIAMLVVTLVVLGAIPVLGFVGARALLDSTGGRDATDDNLPVQTFPSTPTALYATVADGRLTSTTVFVLDGAGVGGSVVSVPVNADVGFADDARQSLQEVYAEGGLEALRPAVESVLRITLNLAAEADEPAVAALLSSFGPLSVTLTGQVDLGEETIGPGAVELDAAGAAALLTAVPADGAEGGEISRTGDVAALWSAVAAAIGEGDPQRAPATTTAATSAGGFAVAAVPAGIEQFVDQLAAGPVRARGLPARALAGSENPDDLDVVELDGAEALFVFASVAPGSVSGTADGLYIRLEAPAGYDAAVKRTIERLLFVGGNIVSVDTTVEPRSGTVMSVPDEINRDDAARTNEIFGDFEFVEPTTRIDGVDLTITLGTDYLEGVDA